MERPAASQDMTDFPIVTAGDVFDEQQSSLQLQWLAGHKGADRQLEMPTARYPGMALVGHLNYIHPNRVQVLGTREVDYLNSFKDEELVEQLTTLFACETCAMVVITNGAAPPERMIELANIHAMPLFSSPEPSPRLIDALQYFLTRALAERMTIHGVFMEIMGAGVLLTGESGIGKSEVALELLSRNHRLIADDAVELARVAPNVIEGRCPEALQGFMEVRGLGILNVRALFGETAVTQHKRHLNLIVRFEQMSKSRLQEIDRLQAEKKSRSLLGIEIPEVLLFVAPGRNLAVLVETAARNHLQHLRGIDPLGDLIAQQQSVMQRGGKQDFDEDEHKPEG
jgi:HPr kinase/phosphorylase